MKFLNNVAKCLLSKFCLSTSASLGLVLEEVRVEVSPEKSHTGKRKKGKVGMRSNETVRFSVKNKKV